MTFDAAGEPAIGDPQGTPTEQRVYQQWVAGEDLRAEQRDPRGARGGGPGAPAAARPAAARGVPAPPGDRDARAAVTRMRRPPIVIREAVSLDGRRVTLSVQDGGYLIRRYPATGARAQAELRSLPLVYGLMPDEERRIPRARWGPYRARKGAKARARAIFEAWAKWAEVPAIPRLGRV